MFRRTASAVRRVYVLRRLAAPILVLSLALAATASVGGPASAQDVIHVTEADAESAPIVDPIISLIVEADTNPYFYTYQFDLGPDMSSDGRWIVYPDSTPSGPRLFRLDTASGQRTQIKSETEGVAPHIVDDGSKVIFETGSSVWLWDAKTRVSSSLNGLRDGARFASISDNGLVAAWTQTSNDGNNEVVVQIANQQQRWPSGSSASHVSANGRYLFYFVNESDLVRRDLVSGEVVSTPGYRPNPFGSEADRSTSDDGALIATSGPYLNDYHLGSAVTVSEVGGDDLLLVRHPLMTSSIALPPAFLSGDGSNLLLPAGDSHAEPGHKRSLYLVDVVGGGTRRAVVPFMHEVITTTDDGARALIFTTTDFESYQLWLVDFDVNAAPTVMVEQLQHPQLTDQLRRLYRAVLGREPSSQELLYWSKQRAGGTSLAWIADQFISSPEFIAANGSPNDEEFLTLVMENLVVFEDWTDYLAELAVGHTRGQVAVAVAGHPKAVWGRTDPFAVSPTESMTTSWPSPPRAAQIWRLYQAYFLRSADQAGLNYWLDLYWTGTSLDVISGHMAASPEFVRRYGSLSNAEFVDRVYGNVLGRRPDVAGRQYWTDQLAAGLSRGQMMIGFSDSAEFVRTTDSIPPGG